MAIANDLRKGNAIRYEGDLLILLDRQRVKPGKGPAYVQTTLRNYRTGRTSQVRFGSNDTVEIVPLMRRKLEYSYRDNVGYVFLDPESFEQTVLSAELIEPVKDYVVEGKQYTIVFTDDNTALEVELDSSIDLKVIKAPEGVKGDSATNVRKPVTVETGLELNVPLFITEGEVIKIDTRTGEYISRA